MAYNPFNIFRRNQKAIFAVITVIIMFVFVMSSGLGGGADFFDWLPQWLGKKSRQGDVICKIDGAKIYSRELEVLRHNRAMANQFMLLAAQEVAGSLDQYQSSILSQIKDPETNSILQQARGAASILRFRDIFGQSPQGQFQIREAERRLTQVYGLLESPTAKQNEKDFVRALMFQQMLTDMTMRSRDGQYFLSAPNRNQGDEINFLLWQKKADEMGVKFTDNDVNSLISREFHNYLSSDVPIRKKMAQEFGGFNMETCVRAIGEEFRVRTAQLAVLGPGMVFAGMDRSFNGANIFATPYELFEFYREKCSPTDYGAIPVPAAAFVDKVKGEPAKDELQKLYDEYKSQEPNPGRETPGFRTPRMAKLEWVSATGEEPYYQKMAEEALKTGELQCKIGSMLTIPLPGMSPALVAAALAPQKSKELLLDVESVREEYRTSVVEPHNATIQTDWAFPSFVTRFLDTSAVRPAAVAAAIGGQIGGIATGAGPLSGVGAYGTAVRAFEVRERIMTQMPLFLGAVPGPGLLGTLVGGEAATRAQTPKPLPIEAHRQVLVNHLTEHTARQLMQNDMKTFVTEVNKLVEPKIDEKTKRPENKPLTPEKRAAVQKFISEYAAKRGWKVGGSQKLESEWTLEDDAGLAPLKEALTKESPHGNMPIQFGEQFFWQVQGGAFGGPPQRVQATGLFKPEYYPNQPNRHASPAAKPEPVYLVWRTEEAKSKEAEGFATPAMQRQLIDAWKLMKARDLARERAEAIAAAVRAAPGDTPAVIDQTLREQAELLRSQIASAKVRDRVKVFLINGVCPLTSADPTGMMMLMGGLYDYMQPIPNEAFVRGMPPTTDIPYPTKAMADSLMDHRKDLPKTTMVLTDKARDTFYVATLERRDVKTLDQFKFTVYTDQMAGILGQARQAVYASFDRDAQRQTFESVTAMLKQEFRFEITDEQKKKLEDNDKRGNVGE